MFIPDFPIGSTVDNKRIMMNFKCRNMGGMRRSHRTNTLVLIADYTKVLYADRWEDNIIHYTGVGKKGDQILSYDQNRTLAGSATNGVGIHYFEVHIPTQYIYKGRVELAGEPFQEIQIDSENENRKVWIFPIRVINGWIEPK